MLFAITTEYPPVEKLDWNTFDNDEAEGGGFIVSTKKDDGTRSSVRDHVVSVQSRFPKKIELATHTMVTKILHCREPDGSIRAYGVEAVEGQGMIPVSPLFTGKWTNPAFKTFYARYEIILSAGPFETPRILMLSGIGNKGHLAKFGLESMVDLPGVGENLQDRIEAAIVWSLKKDHVLWEGCKFLYKAEDDPCLKEWEEERRNAYSASAALYAWSLKSNASLPYRDIWSFWSPASFKGYYQGWGQDTASVSNAFVNNILKAHTSSKGWVRLTGSHPQDILNINKNQFQTPEALYDLEVMKDEIKRSRAFAKERLGFRTHVKEETWPGSHVETDQQIKDFVKEHAWGHRMAVIDNEFRVHGVLNLRVVDNSVWPNIPGMFATTPIYMISEKAADAVLEHARLQGWGPSA